MNKKRVVFLGYGDLSPNGSGKAKEVFYITKGLYKNGLLAKALVRDFNKNALKTVNGLEYSLVRPIPLGNLTPKLLGAIRKVLKININNRYYSERLFSICANNWLIKNRDKYDIVLGMSRLVESFKIVKQIGKTIILYGSGEHPLSFINKYKKENEKWKIQKVPMAWDERQFARFAESIRLSDFIITLSRESKRSYIEHGYDSKKIYICPLGTDLSLESRAIIKTNFNKKCSFNVVFMGRVGVMKGTQYLLEAWKRANLPKNAVLHICGSHPYGASEIINRFKNLKNVCYPGFVNAKEYFEKADVFVLPTLSEGFPRSVLEGMSYGLPGIVTPAASESILHKKNGIIVPYCDSNSIAYWLKQLYKNKEMRKKIGLEAKKVMEDYTWEKFSNNIIESTEDVIRKVRLQGKYDYINS